MAPVAATVVRDSHLQDVRRKMQIDHNCARQLQLMAAGCLLFAVPFHPVESRGVPRRRDCAVLGQVQIHMVSFQRQSSASHQRLLVLVLALSSVPSAVAPASKTVRYCTALSQVSNEGLDKELHV